MASRYHDLRAWRKRQAGIQHATPQKHLERLTPGGPGLEPVDAFMERLMLEFEGECHEIGDVSAPIGGGWDRPDPNVERKTQIDLWLAESQRPQAA